MSSDQLTVAPVRHYGRWVSAGAVLTVLVLAIRQFALAEIDYDVVGDFLFSAEIISGLWGTLLLTATTMAFAIVVGVIVALMRRSANPVLRVVGTFHVWLFRSIPALVLLLICFNFALVVDHVTIPLVFDGPTNKLITPYAAALLGLGLSESAYVAEIVRGGMLSVPEGQVDAAKSLGMSPALTMRRVVLPQAMRVIIPPIGNETIGMLKYTALAYAVSYQELLSRATAIYVQNFEVMELLFAVTFWYIVLTSILSIGQHFLEKRLSAGYVR